MRKLKQVIKRLFPGIIYRKQLSSHALAAMIAEVDKVDMKDAPLSAAGRDIFTYHGEDGIINYLLRQLQPVNPVFVDIGSGDCIKSNCATLATHFNWRGLFLDSDAGQLSVGKAFYKKERQKGARINIVNEKVTPGNINIILRREGISGEIGLLSIDIDGNDYWIWKAVDEIRPRIVIIEAKVEFGERNVVVPYGEHNHHAVNFQYNGASVAALSGLGKQKGYKLVGANCFGYNLFFVREEEAIPEVSSRSVLQHPETINSFYPESFFSSHTFA